MTFGTIVEMPSGQQGLIFDKSGFQTLSRQEHGLRLFRYKENITPVLLREILTDLSKAESRLEVAPTEAVQVLARKFMGSGGVVNADCRKLLAASLTGEDSDGDGRPLVDDYSTHEASDGTLSVLIDVMEGNRAILRWAQAEFSDRERRAAAGLRAASARFSVDGLRGRLRQHHVLVPRPKDIPDLAVIADGMLGQASLQRPFLDWMMDQCFFSSRLRERVWHAWERDRRPMLAEFAPYAHHCARILLLLLIGMTHRKLSDRPTNRIDVEYLFYSPFCRVFVSSDRLHQQLAPLVLWENQRFVLTQDFRTELRVAAAQREERREPAEDAASRVLSEDSS